MLIILNLILIIVLIIIYSYTYNRAYNCAYFSTYSSTCDFFETNINILFQINLFERLNKLNYKKKYFFLRQRVSIKYLSTYKLFL
jgi:hypothetical protein